MYFNPIPAGGGQLEPPPLYFIIYSLKIICLRLYLELCF